MTSRSGTLMCLASSVGFGVMAVFAKLAYEQGATVGTALTVRLAIAATALWALAAARGLLPVLRRVRRRDLLAGFGLLGALAFSVQSGAYFLALQRIDASLAVVLLFSYPPLVAVGAVVLGRERPNRRKAVAVVAATLGVALVAGSGIAGGSDAAGIALALGAAVVYTAYMFTSERVADRVPAVLLTAMVCTGSAITIGITSAVLGEWRPGAVTAEGWLWLGLLGLVPGAFALTMLFAGLQRVRASTAAILSTLEPVITVVSAAIVFGERLAPLQAVGGALVIAAVVILNTGARRSAARTAAPAPLAVPVAQP